MKYWKKDRNDSFQEVKTFRGSTLDKINNHHPASVLRFLKTALVRAGSTFILENYL